MLARLPEDISDLDESVLHMGGNDLDIILVEGDELKFLQGRLPFSASLCFDS